MQHDPVFAAAAVPTSCERVVLYTSSTAADGAGSDGPRETDKHGAMTANLFGFCNTAEAFVAIEVRRHACHCATTPDLNGTHG